MVSLRTRTSLSFVLILCFSIGHVQIHVNHDAPNNDLMKMDNIDTRTKCVEECRRHAECACVTYKSFNHTCTLKYSMGRLVAKVDVDTVYVFTTGKFIL